MGKMSLNFYKLCLPSFSITSQKSEKIKFSKNYHQDLFLEGTQIKKKNRLRWKMTVKRRSDIRSLKGSWNTISPKIIIRDGYEEMFQVVIFCIRAFKNEILKDHQWRLNIFLGCWDDFGFEKNSWVIITFISKFIFLTDGDQNIASNHVIALIKKPFFLLQIFIEFQFDEDKWYIIWCFFFFFLMMILFLLNLVFFLLFSWY